jgi:hypothetical protein
MSGHESVNRVRDFGTLDRQAVALHRSGECAGVLDGQRDAGSLPRLEG